MKKSNKILYSAMVCALLITGCSKAEEPKKEPEKVETKEKEKEYSFAIGDEKDASYSLYLKNETGQTITDLKIKKSDEKDFSDNVLKEDEKIDNDTVVLWNVHANQTNEESKDPEDKKVRESYSIEATAGETTFTINNIILETVDLKEDFILKYDEEKQLAYVEFTSNETNKVVSTLKQAEAEKEELENAEEDPVEKEEENFVDEDAAAQTPEEDYYSEPVDQTPSYETPSYQAPADTAPTVPNTPSYEQPSAPADDDYTPPAQNNGGGCLQ